MRTYTHNPARQITSHTLSNDGDVFGGDVNVSRGYSVNGLNQYTGAGPASFSYDANGNLTGDGTNSYSYDVENRLIGLSSSAGSATLLYDQLGRLFETGSASGSTTRFH
jgi:YD repeat-containing protein